MSRSSRVATTTPELHRPEHMPEGGVFLDEWGSAAGRERQSELKSARCSSESSGPTSRRWAWPGGRCLPTDILVLRPSNRTCLGLGPRRQFGCRDRLRVPGVNRDPEPRVSWDYLSRWPVELPTSDVRDFMLPHSDSSAKRSCCAPESKRSPRSETPFCRSCSRGGCGKDPRRWPRR